MDLDYNDAELAFQREVRDFVAAHLPPAVAAKVHGGRRLAKEDFVTWQRVLHGRGWAGYSWPREFGGTGWNAVQRHLFDCECAAAGAPLLLPFGLMMVAPVIMRFGSAEQQRHFLPRILAAEDWWCQGYSEPGSGSDLASLKTRAVRDGDHYLVNGQKTWNTLGQHADWIFCLVRTATEGRPQEGISFLLIPMKTPGVTVRPIRLLDGECEVNEVWFEDVRVPAANLVGEENKGWTYAKYLLAHERTGIAGVGRSKPLLQRLRRIVAAERSGGRPLAGDPRLRDRLAQLEIELTALEITLLRVASAEAAGRGPGPEASMLKIRGSEIQQNIAELAMLALGPRALPWLPEALEAGWQGDPVGPDYAAPVLGTYLNMRKTTIYGGSNEIQKNIIAQQILGL